MWIIWLFISSDHLTLQWLWEWYSFNIVFFSDNESKAAVKAIIASSLTVQTTKSVIRNGKNNVLMMCSLFQS